ncbi:hypothetical protein [uncultured Eubacterium sp.]|uniref:hypothetical protein n=1 Tax=uncultured Eubacterium sp. TaxID=165185 RepID=UPI002599BC50|nr:hypothetical protein [uncultured Eubacterium sp.]
MKTLSINFYAENIKEETKKEFLTAVEYENNAMTLQLLADTIERLEKQANNLRKDINDNGDDDGQTKQKKLEGILANIQDNKELVADINKELVTIEPIYNKVIDAMTKKNDAHFGNSKDVVRTVLRCLATVDNSKLIKYAIIPAFESPALYNALETIHINSKALDDGNIELTDEVKTAYKTATKELDSIIKNTFSLPFETPYTSKTRVKMTAEDRKLLNDCYVKGFTNKFDIDENVVTFKKRQINTLVKVKMDRKTKKETVDYSGLASVIANIVLKHYFA